MITVLLVLALVKGVQVVGRWKYRIRQRVPEFTSERDERMKMLVNSCISEVDRIGMRESRKSCAACEDLLIFVSPKN